MKAVLLLASATAVLLFSLAVGCGDVSTPASTGTSVASTPTVTPSTTDFSHPWSGNYGTVTEADLTTAPPSGPTTEFVPIAGGEEYADELISWLQNVPAELENPAGPPSPEDDDYDPMSASPEEAESWREYGKRLGDYVDLLEDIEPPLGLSEAHKDFIEGWRVLCRYCEELSDAVESKNASALEDVRSTWLDAINYLLDADAAMRAAIGHPVLFQ